MHCRSYLPGYYSMRDLNEDSSSSNWPMFYGDRASANGQYCNGFYPSTVTNSYTGYEKYALKQTMLEHEAVFKHQVFELHRLYKIQRDMMDEIRRKELYNHRIPIETSSSSSRLVSDVPSEDAQKLAKSTFALGFTEGNGMPTGRVPFENGGSSKDCEILESRPSKVRKQLFDLQLPADKYIDFEEGDNYSPCTNNKIASGSSVKLKMGGDAKINCNGDTSRSSSCLKSSIGLADLNEPIEVEEVTLPTAVDFIGCVSGPGEIKDLDLAAKRKSQFLLGLPKESLLKSGSSNGSSVNRLVEGKGNERDWLSSCYEAGPHTSHLNSVTHDLQPEKSSWSPQLKHNMHNKAHRAGDFLPSDHVSGDQWRESTVRGLEISEKRRDLFNFNHLDSVMASHTPDPHPFLHSSALDNGWSHSISTWGKHSSSSLTQKLTSVQTHPPINSLGSLSKTFLPSAQSREIFGDKWDCHASSGSKPGFGSGLPNCNGFYRGSASGSKDLATHFPSVGFDYLNCNKDVKEASERSINYSTRSYLMGSNGIDLSANDRYMKTVLPKSSSNFLEIIDEETKCEDHLKVLPWLKSKPSCKNEVKITGRDSNSSDISFLQAASNHLSGKSETVKGKNQLFTPNMTLASCDDHEVGAKRSDGVDWLAKGKILGFPFFNHPCAPKNDSSSLVSTSASLPFTGPKEDDVRKGAKIGVIDINLACEPEFDTLIAAEVLVVENERDSKEVANFRTNIDLNSSLSEDEVRLVPSVASTSVNVKIAVEIDLEAPAFPESEEEGTPPAEEQQCEMPMKSPQLKAELLEDEVPRMAAEALVAISSSVRTYCVGETTCHPSEGHIADSLLWFVEAVTSFEDESKAYKVVGDNETSSCDEIDYFEALTLNLTEVKEEEYMPKPLVLENQNLEETGTDILPSRLRKGQARRGRPRRDFQRDILPGLASLSRHEVTEDLQTFGGLMKATGHVWNSGLTRRSGTRNGGARGRRRSVLVVDHEPEVTTMSTICTPLVQQLNSIEVGLEDRNLTGWGKTPRRPRRQRCPSGNPPPSIALA